MRLWTPRGVPPARLKPPRTHRGEPANIYSSSRTTASIWPMQTAEQKRPALSLRLIAGAPVALVGHARAEGPGLDQLQRDVVGDGWQERRATTDDDGIAKHAELVDEAELDRL